MQEDAQALGAAGKPLVVHPGPSSINDLLRYIDPVPDEETERFVAAIYADRHEALDASSTE